MLSASHGGLVMLFDCRFKVLKVSRFSKLPCFRLSPNRLPERSSERRAFIVGHTSIVGISSSQFSEKSKLPREIGNWKIFVNRLFLTDRLLQVNATFYSMLCRSSSFLDSLNEFERVIDHLQLGNLVKLPRAISFN